LVLLLLVVMWVGAGVWYFRGRPEGRTSDSIGSFHHQLRVLQRTGPTAIDPAHSMKDEGLGLVAPIRIASGGIGRSRLSTPSMAASRRRQVQKRRRDVFFGLCLGVVGSLLLGFIPGLQVMWLLSVVLMLVLGTYVFMLTQMRNATVERAAKVRYLPDARHVEPAFLLRRSAN
jgi:hypothetical protein